MQGMSLTITNPWPFSYDVDHMSWIYLYPCMLSNPCRYLDKPNSMRLQLNHILSNLYISKSLQNGGWRQGSTNPFNISFGKFLYQISWLSPWIHKCSLVVGWNPKWRSFTNWRGIPKNKMNTREKTRGTLKNKSNHTSTRQQTHKIHKVHEQSKGNNIHGRVHPKSYEGDEVLMI